jgi:hypothetical protein
MTYQHVLLNPSIMMLPGHTDGPEAEVLVVARRLYFGTSGIVLPGETEPPKLWESSLVTVVVPLKRLLEAAATNAGEQIAVEFKHVQVDGDSCIETKNESGSDTKHCEYGGVHPCIPDRCEERPITQLAVGPEDPRLFTCCGGKTFLLDFRSAASTQTTQQCSAFCGRQQPWLTPVDESALLTRGALKLGRSQQLLLDGRSCDDWACEKNWAPMPYGAQLYMSRSYAPQHEVVHVGTPPAYGKLNKLHEQEQAVKVSLTTPTPQAPQPPEGTPEGAGELRGGSPWVEMRLPGRLGG